MKRFAALGWGLVLSVAACVSAGQREADEVRAYWTQEETWNLVAINGQEMPAEMPNGQKVDRASLTLVGPEFPKDFRIGFRYRGLRRSPRNPHSYEGRISAPDSAGKGRMQALLFQVTQVEYTAEDGDRIFPVDETPLVTFLGDRVWLTLAGHMMVFRREE